MRGSGATTRGARGGGRVCTTGRGGAAGRSGGGARRPPVCHRCGVEGHISRDCVSIDRAEVAQAAVPMPPHSISYVDTHCHIDYMVEQAGVSCWSEFLKRHPMPKTYAGCITTFCDPAAIMSDTMSQWPDIRDNHGGSVHASFGLHPHNAKYWNESLEARLVELNSSPQAVAWGEIGLDVTSTTKGGSGQDEQMEVFLRQLQLASSFGSEKPIVLHFRGDVTVLYSLLDSAVARDQKLHLHCWGDPSVDNMKMMADAFPNLYFGFTGGIFQKEGGGRGGHGGCRGYSPYRGRPTGHSSAVLGDARLCNVLRHVPMDRMVLESDAPYMLPGILRPPGGNHAAQPVNHCGNIPYIAAAIAELKQLPSVDTLLAHVQKNVTALYDIAGDDLREEQKQKV